MFTALSVILSLILSGVVTDSRTGEGIKGVTVSDGCTCVATDASGRFTIEADSLARTLSVSVPDGYEIPLGKDGRPVFFKYIPSTGYDFALEPRKTSCDKFSLVTVTDIHVISRSDMKRFDRESVPDIKRTLKSLDCPGIGMSLGDQVTDTPEYTKPVQKRLASFKKDGRRVPFFLCIGNHDHFSADGTDEYAVTERFVRGSAPRDYSFNIGGVHFIVMDDIQYKGVQRDGVKIAYYNGLTDSQVEWLRQDISLVDGRSEKEVVLCVHSPLFGSFTHKDDVKALLGQFSRAHVLSGHEHNINNVWLSDRIWEHNLQSLCGSWWYSNVSPNGSPNGYSVMTFVGGRLAQEYNKATGEDESFQLRVYDGNDTYDEHTPYSGLKGPSKMPRSYGWPEELKGCFIVRVWDGTAAREGFGGWDVKFVQNGKETPMRQTSFKFEDALTYAYMVNVHGAPCGGRGIYRPKLDAFWILPAPCGDPAAEKDWEIVATHKMPDGSTAVYRTSLLKKDYRGLAAGKKSSK